MGWKDTVKKLLGVETSTGIPMIPEEVELNQYLEEERRDRIRHEVWKKRAERTKKLWGITNYGPPETKNIIPKPKVSPKPNPPKNLLDYKYNLGSVGW